MKTFRMFHRYAIFNTKNRSDVLMAYQEKYGGYGTNDDECGFDYFVDVSQMELGEHSILVQLLDEKDKVISEKDLKINII